MAKKDISKINLIGKNKKDTYLVVPAKDMIIFPNSVIAMFLKDKNVLKTISFAIKNGVDLFFTRDTSGKDSTTPDDLAKVGVIVKTLQYIEFPNGSVKVFLEGRDRAVANRYKIEDDKIIAEVSKIEEVKSLSKEDEVEIKAIVRNIVKDLEEYVALNYKTGYDLITNISNIGNPVIFGDLLMFYLPIEIDKKQQILECFDLKERLKKISQFLKEEVELSHIKREVDVKVKNKMDKSQREYYLNEQIRILKQELGTKDSVDAIVDHYNNLLLEKEMPKYVKDKVADEIKRLEISNSHGTEFGLIRSYLDLVFELPWSEKAKIKKNIKEIEEFLDNSHYGMEETKKRIVEMIGIQMKTGHSKRNIICLYGPPGVGKTSLAKAIAEALDRDFIKVALGGVRDEAEIRGHRKTYIGAMPGKIIAGMKKAKVLNPVMLLDEIDKVGSDSRGDPTSALLEVLDPEQNKNFTDHYLEIDYDLSNVIFIATANSLNMPKPLLDRLEIINIPSYLERDKEEIAKKYLIPSIMKEFNLKENEVNITPKAISHVIKYYTREAGIRGLKRQIEKVLRKIILEILKESKTKKTRRNKKDLDIKIEEKEAEVKTITVDDKDIKKYLGVKKYEHDVIEQESMIGIVNGLAYTEVGGDILIIEGVKIPNGKGEIRYTGTLGDVMKESIQVAHNFIKSKSQEYKLKDDEISKSDIHLHVPDGSTPKDGPSAGAAIALIIYSIFKRVKIKNTIGITGEISLRGRVLPIGGLREKLTSAIRSGVKEVIIPYDNLKDLEELEFVKSKLKIHAVKYFDEVIKYAIE